MPLRPDDDSFLPQLARNRRGEPRLPEHLPEHVGLGLDYVFDIAELEEYVQANPARFPAEIRVPGGYTQVEPERFPIIAAALLKKGYPDSAIQGILGHNNLRVARQVWK